MFEEGDSEGFQASLENSLSINPISIDELDAITLENRAKKICDFFNFARLEGFEPPTL